jgi:hypothetical protein
MEQGLAWHGEPVECIFSCADFLPTYLIWRLSTRGSESIWDRSCMGKDQRFRQCLLSLHVYNILSVFVAYFCTTKPYFIEDVCANYPSGGAPEIENKKGATHMSEIRVKEGIIILNFRDNRCQPWGHDRDT